MGASAVATWCLAVASAAPSVAYLRLPLTGHLEAWSMVQPADNSHHLLSACLKQNLSCELFESQTKYWPVNKARCHPEARVVCVPKDLNSLFVLVL